MKRHYCVNCTRKLNEDKMKLFQLPFVRAKYVWVCLVCCSRLTDRAREVET